MIMYVTVAMPFSSIFPELFGAGVIAWLAAIVTKGLLIGLHRYQSTSRLLMIISLALQNECHGTRAAYSGAVFL